MIAEPEPYAVLMLPAVISSMQCFSSVYSGVQQTYLSDKWVSDGGDNSSGML